MKTTISTRKTDPTLIMPFELVAVVVDVDVEVVVVVVVIVVIANLRQVD